jgi:hypothetical protein
MLTFQKPAFELVIEVGSLIRDQQDALRAGGGAVMMAAAASVMNCYSTVLALLLVMMVDMRNKYVAKDTLPVLSLLQC